MFGALCARPLQSYLDRLGASQAVGELEAATGDRNRSRWMAGSHGSKEPWDPELRSQAAPTRVTCASQILRVFLQ